MSVPQSNPLVEYGLRRIVDLTRGIKSSEREAGKLEERALAARVEVENRLTEREQTMYALTELGIDQDAVEALMDSTADEYDKEWGSYASQGRAITKALRDNAEAGL